MAREVEEHNKRESSGESAMRNAIVRALRHKRLERGQHPGLLLQRYLCAPATGEQGDPEEKRALLEAAISAAGQAELRHLYKAAYERWCKSLPDLTAATTLRTLGRLVIGLGSENVLETGITLHHTYGLPYLPGSALKGLAAHYCDQVWGEAEQKFKKGNEYHSLLFGTTEDSGCIIFHDGWLVVEVNTNPLQMDVMTPHHPSWVDGSAPPTDFDSPNPVPFLSVAGAFHVAVSWHGPDDDYPKAVAWTELALDLLVVAIGDWGIGGKTSSGYGRMKEVDAANRKRPFSATALGLPAAGSIVEATLLEAPKKDKPWRAKITLRNGRDLAGPIEGTPPTPPQPGQNVQLIVTEVGENRIRFQWLSPPAR